MSDYEALRKVINHEANQDDDGGFFAKLGGIDPEPDDDGPTAKGLFQHMHRDNGGKLPAGLTPIRNTTGRNIFVSPYPRFGTSNYFTVRISIEEYNRAKRLQAVILHRRYWHDHQGQPRRNPLMRPLLHNGRKPR